MTQSLRHSFNNALMRRTVGTFLTLPQVVEHSYCSLKELPRFGLMRLRTIIYLRMFWFFFYWTITARRTFFFCKDWRCIRGSVGFLSCTYIYPLSRLVFVYMDFNYIYFDIYEKGQVLYWQVGICCTAKVQFSHRRNIYIGNWRNVDGHSQSNSRVSWAKTDGDCF